MIYFISDGSQKNIKEEKGLVVVNDFNVVLDYIKNRTDSNIFFDTETTSLDAYYAELHLLIVGDNVDKYVIDCSCGYPLEKIFENESKFRWVGQNIKFDWKVLKTKLNVKLTNLYDTMIAEQRITQNTGLLVGLEHLCNRYLGYIPASMEENTGLSFTKIKPKEKLLTNKHIVYAAGDIEPLTVIKTKQAVRIGKFNLYFLLYGIEFPLIRVLAKSELEGFKLNVDKWRELAKSQKAKKHELEVKLDNLVLSYRDSFFERDSKEWLMLNGGKTTRVRNAVQSVDQLGLFGGDTKTIEAERKKSHFNYKSTPQIVKLFSKLKQPLPTEDGKYLIPIADEKGNISTKYGYDSEFNQIPFTTFTTREDYLQLLLIENPEHKCKEFLELLIKQRQAETAVTNFGENFVSKINRVTGHIHTIYRQAFAVTGRLQSGGGKSEPDKFNAQNVPTEEGYRECFTIDNTDTHEMVMSDLSGAEVRLLCDKANDRQLYDWAVSKDDAHSPIAQACWRNIFLYRAGKGCALWTDSKEFFDKKENPDIDSFITFNGTKEDIENLEKSKTYIVSKTVNKAVRTVFKNVTFAAVYGVFPAKCAKMLNVAIDEAEVVLGTIKRTIPASFNYIDSQKDFVLGEKDYRGNRGNFPNHPYLILNTRTNSRVNFIPVAMAKKFGESVEWGKINEIENSCANSPIQGTQADMLKESMVEIDRVIEENNLDCNLLLNVHDELGYRNLKGQLFPFSNDNEETVTNLEFKDFLPAMMIKVANRYMTHFTMASETTVKDSWTK